jgi:anti-sigma-K factor RskA
MKFAGHRLLDALCAEYLLGTLRGGARRRFEAARKDEPLVDLRLRHWEAIGTPRYSKMMEIQPRPQLWQRLERDLDLSQYRQRWYQRTGFWKAWAWVATAAFLLVLAVSVRTLPIATSVPPEIAQLSGANGSTQITARRSKDGGTLVLQANRPILAGPNQSYELWVIPGRGVAPISLAVLGNLDATITLPRDAIAHVHAGATLAISTEPAGGSPTGLPTGTIIAAGQVAS